MKLFGKEYEPGPEFQARLSQLEGACKMLRLRIASKEQGELGPELQAAIEFFEKEAGPELSARIKEEADVTAETADGIVLDSDAWNLKLQTLFKK